MKRNKLEELGLTTLAVLAIASVSVAQGPPNQGQPGQPGPRQGGQGFQRNPGMQRGGSGMMLVRMSSVQKELGMTADQVKQVNEFRPMGGPGGPGFQGGPPQGGQGHAGGHPQGGQGNAGGPPKGGGFGQGPMNGPLAEILSEKQLKRLHQLELQFNAPMAFMQPDVNRELNLTQDQRAEIDDIIKKAGFGMRGPGGPGFQGGPGGPPQGGGQGGPGFQGGPGGPGFQGGPGGPPQGGGQGPMGNFKEMQAKKASALKSALAILTGEQKAAWKKLSGAEFTNWEEPKRPNPNN